jgi:diacylglycerol kinase family enzyme
MKKSKADALDGAARLAAGRLALRKELAKAEPMAAEIAIDDEPLAMEGMLAIEFVNTTYTGPGLPLPAAARPGDGLLGIIGIGEREGEAMLSWLEAPHTEPMPVVAARGRRIDFTWKGAPLRLDDCPIKGTREPRSGTVEIEIIPARLMAPHRSIDNADDRPDRPDARVLRKAAEGRITGSEVE